MIVFGSAPILDQLARDWMKRDDFAAETVMELQQAMHAAELARVSQPIQVTLNITPAEGMAPAPTRPQPAYADDPASFSSWAVVPEGHHEGEYPVQLD